MDTDTALDLAEAVVLAAGRVAHGSQTIGATIDDLARALADAFPPAYVPAREGRYQCSACGLVDNEHPAELCRSGWWEPVENLAPAIGPEPIEVHAQRYGIRSGTASSPTTSPARCGSTTA